MAFTDKIKLIIEVVADGANHQLDTFKTKLSDADGALAKTKATAGAAFDSIKANAGALALGAGAALVGFGVKAVGAFQDTALAAGEMSDKLLLSVEDASRLIEVAGDLGVEAGTLESTIGRMNKTAGETPAKFDEIGASIVRNKDGTINVKDTFLGVVDALNRMPDAGERAKAGADIFGKGWAEIAELVETGSADIVAAMDKVAKGKVISPEEVAKAREFREKMDALKDSVEELALAAGETLVPILGSVADAFAGIAPAVETAGGVIDGAIGKIQGISYEIGSFFGKLATPLTGSFIPEQTLKDLEDIEAGIQGTFDTMAAGAGTMDAFTARLDQAGITGYERSLLILMFRDSLDAATRSMNLAADAGRMYIDQHGELQGSLQDTTADTDDLTVANSLLEDQIRETTDRYKDLKGELSAEEAFHNAEGMWADLGKSADAAYIAAANGAADAADKAFAHQGKVIDAKNAVVELGDKYADLPEEEVTRIVALIDEGALEEAERRFNILARNRQFQITATAAGGIGLPSQGNRHTGGPVGGSQNPNVQAGEMFVRDGPMSQAGRVYPRSQVGDSDSGSGGGDTYVLTVNNTARDLTAADLSAAIRRMRLQR